MSSTSAFPNSIFSTQPSSVAFFDFGYGTSRRLFMILHELCELNDETGFVFIMTRPEPISYFYKNFGWLPAASISRNDIYEPFGELVKRDPGNSPADGIVYRMDEIIYIADALSFAVYGSQRFELGVIATFTAGADFKRICETKSVKPFLMDCEEAFDYLRHFAAFTQFRNSSIRRKEFLASWECRP